MSLKTEAQVVKASLDIVPTLIEHLEQDRIILLPMDTLYGLVVHGGRPKAIAALRALKQLGQEQPLTILTRGDRVREVAVLNASAERMISHFPCPVTMIVEANPQLNPEITQGFSTIFIACPDRFIYDLIGAIPFPLVCAGARVGTEPITHFDAAMRYFSDRVSLIVRGERSHYGRRGTLIDFTLESPTIMNFGPISVDDLRPLLPEIILPSHLMK
ncbi:L-threonylcarbamoyladenylate synthase [Oscillatoria sp. FACHB-1406]|uniref:L-threonylcarbamoyladenylate synthase n=1 Tax=Oscillatoria sp. FACHB-1406 TaxID=2692846 RepID=UPI001687FB2D|nr:L-threonylcarbamoyladenylate synthase [Oscillatoria sp. FACHB-1406]MBD2580224.1 L-threonylcarbamoyladenylate synthase [Oscillatoria sp. FACHB-1406]